MKKIYKKDGTFDIDVMIHDGWKYRMFPWTHKIIYDEMFKLINEDDFAVLSTTEMIENTAAGPLTKIKGSVLINENGMNAIIKWMKENADLITKESPSGELH